MKLIGAGFGRTGTASLQKALEILGFGPCYHMRAVIGSSRRLRFWDGVTRGETAAFHHHFADYQATVDWPGCTYYRELMTLYPEAKVLLSVRDADRWYDSTRDTIFALTELFPHWFLRLVPRLRRFVAMTKRLIWDGTFNGRFATDPEAAKAIFEAHNRIVQEVVPPERLLVYRVQEGWEPLCAFLGVPVPERPFPHVNDRATVQKAIRAAKMLIFTTRIVGFLGLGVGLLVVWRKLVRR